jgi:protein-disulfide isomerase
MAKEQGEPQSQEHAPPPGRGVDPLALATLAGVLAVLVISFASWRDVSRIDRRLGELEARLDQLGTRAPAHAAQRGPDPNRVYTVRTDGAPSRGNASAPVTIAEFSDFQ